MASADEEVGKGRTAAEKLPAAKWKPYLPKVDLTKPVKTADGKLPAMRLYPPGGNAWFIERLTEPSPETQAGRAWTTLPRRGGEFHALPRFRCR